MARIQALLGGEPVTGPLHDERDLVQLVRRGVPTAAVESFLGSAQLSFNAIEEIVHLKRRTFQRRQAAAEPLEPAESDRLMRLVTLVALSEETFADANKARLWLTRENRALGGETPLSMADTERGARHVETLLGRIAHGLAA